MRTVALAGVIGVLAIAPAAVVAEDVAPPTEPGAAPRSALLDDGGTTPVAREGTALAARRGLSRSGLKRRLERQMDRVGGGSGAWVYDIEAARNRVLYSDSGKRSRLLASNSKLFATAPFLDRFGAEGKLETGLWARGRRAGAKQRVLRGSLVLVGDGDPALASPKFANRNNLPLTRMQPLARAVRRAGITRVKGNVRADDTIFDSRRSVPQHGITGGPFLSPLSGLSYDSGYDGARFANNPARVAGRELIKRLRRVGVTVTGHVKVGDSPRKLRESPPLAAVKSPSAERLIAQTNTPSDNFFAEMLLKRLGARKGRQGTTARGARKAERFAAEAGSGVRLENGSGLSRRNAASPRNVGRLLVHMAREDALQRAWRGSLAVAGRTGTLAGRMRGSAAEGRCIGKTGTIDGVSALSGYCPSGAGLVAFSILMNNVNIDAARSAQDKMVAAIARYG